MVNTGCQTVCGADDTAGREQHGATLRTFRASSADTPPLSSMTEAMDLATPTAELPAPKNTMRASFSSVSCAFMPLMNLRHRQEILSQHISGTCVALGCASGLLLGVNGETDCGTQAGPPRGHNGARALNVVVEAQHLLPHAIQDAKCLQEFELRL